MGYLGDLVRDIAALGRPADRLLAILAGRQHGVVARWQLLALGFSRDAIQDRVAAGRLHRLHRGVYAVGHGKLTLKGRWMAAVLACGPDAVLSHRAAAALWELRPVPAASIDVTAPRTKKGQKGIRIHRTRTLHEHDHTILDGIPVTSVHRTVLDYAEVAHRQHLRLAIEAADRRELFDLRTMEKLLDRSPGRRGRAALRGLLAEMKGFTPWTRSELERAFLALIREARVPEPQANVLIEGFLVDYFWPRERLVVEVDGYQFHKSRAKFDSDRIQDAKLQLAGYRVLRITETRLRTEPDEVIRDLLAFLSDVPGAAAAGL